MKITGTLIKNFFHCQRQAYLYYYGLNFRSEIVKIGELMHKEQRPKEYIFEKIKIDDIKGNCLIEYKKTSSNLKGTKLQLLYYLDYFAKRGVELKGIIKDLTHGNEYEILLNGKNKEELKRTIISIKNIIKEKMPLKLIKKKECKGCSFFDYCWIE
ncbi:MAG: Dna2/Cas4 domain-containing protein [Nanoarchaeota archaeon]